MYTPPIGTAAKVMHRHDVRMMEPRQHQRLLLEAGDECLISVKLRRQDLDGHATLQRDLRGGIHRAHRAAIEVFEVSEPGKSALQLTCGRRAPLSRMPAQNAIQQAHGIKTRERLRLPA